MAEKRLYRAEFPGFPEKVIKSRRPMSHPWLHQPEGVYRMFPQ
jgi:hypothetical protein